MKLGLGSRVVVDPREVPPAWALLFVTKPWPAPPLNDNAVQLVALRGGK